MNVELTIQEMFYLYPTLFKERADCLSHLFCTIGNGYDWVRGELVINFSHHECDIKNLCSMLVDGKAFQHNKLSLRAESQLYETERVSGGWYEEWHKAYPDDDIEEMKKIRSQTIAKLPDDVYYREPERRKRWGFYVNIPGHEGINFCSNYAYLFNYPDDITPDWKAAIEECMALLIEDGFELPKRNKSYI